MDLKAIQHEAFVFIGDKDEYAEIIPDGNIDEAAELMAEFVHHLWECGMEYTPDTGEGQSNIPDVKASLPDKDNYDYLRGFSDGYSGPEPHECFPEGFKDINEVMDRMWELGEQRK